MGIDITINNDKDNKKDTNPSLKAKLQIRKSLNGNLIIADHEDLDIIVDPKKGKIILFSTDQKNSDHTYDSMNRFMKYLAKKGIISHESVHSGNIYASLEAKIQESENSNVNSLDLALMTIAEFIKKEAPYFMYIKKAQEDWDNELARPESDETTELGVVSHADSKGSQQRRPGSGVSPYLTQKPY